MELAPEPEVTVPPVVSFPTPYTREVTARASGRSTNRRTRIVATIGPASDSVEMLRKLTEAGMDVARIPLAHGTIDEAVGRVRRVREAAPEIGVMADLPGPKIRTTPFPDGGVVLSSGDELLVLPGSVLAESSNKRIGVALDEVALGLEEGDRVALGDGGVSLHVIGRNDEGAIARVISGGRLQGRPGVTVPTSRVVLATPTTDDLARLEALVAEGIDMVAVSFVRSAADMLAVRAAAGSSSVMLCAKIETPEAIADLDAILAVTDSVMVARGDLGVRVPLEDVPHHQKHIIRSGVRFGRPVITATQMLESMVTAPVPTRAEVTDVANAVLDGTSAVMLSAETAVGTDPVNVVATMAKIVLRTEQDFDYVRWGAGLGLQEVSGPPSSAPGITAAITGAAWRAAMEQNAAAIIACTRTGATARVISRFRPSMPIVAATPSLQTARQLSVSWGVDSLIVRESTSTDDIVWYAVSRTVEAGYARAGDVVIVLAGSPNEPDPVTDTIRIVRVG
ncbi:MAG: pyk [Acidimicrobiaceae bacterium]|nr:pyk [Acidimicrobiaceae bacterium]